MWFKKKAVAADLPDNVVLFPGDYKRTSSDELYAEVSDLCAQAVQIMVDNPEDFTKRDTNAVAIVMSKYWKKLSK